MFLKMNMDQKMKFTKSNWKIYFQGIQTSEKQEEMETAFSVHLHLDV